MEPDNLNIVRARRTYDIGNDGKKAHTIGTKFNTTFLRTTKCRALYLLLLEGVIGRLY